MKAKTINKVTLVLSVTWTIGMTIWKACDPNMLLSVGDIVKVAFTLCGLVGGITGSIWLDKIMKVKEKVDE